MSWRPWVLTSTVLIAMVLNLFLLLKERMPTVDQGPDVIKIEERLRHLQYLKEQRRTNFSEMGMDTEMAHAAATYIDNRYARHRERLIGLLEEHAGEVGGAFCPSADLPQPYAAAEFLVYEENQRRDVFAPEKLLTLESQAWFAGSPVESVYNTLEVTESRKNEATVMGVSALLLGRENDVLEGRAPWSQNLLGSWGFSRLKKDSPSIEILAIQYFALMHYLTELANTRDGICS